MMHKHNNKNILKSSGYCTDGCQWTMCDFYDVVTVNEGNTRKDVKTHICTLFDVPIPRCGEGSNGGSLVMCDKIYGKDYEGRP